MKAKRQRRLPKLVAAIGVSALALTGCAEGVTTDEQTGGDGAAEQNLVIGVTTDINSLNPWTATQYQAVDVLTQMYGSLVEFDAELNPGPGLAESWEVSEDGLTVTFKLREGVTFSDGSEFDAEDVIASYETIQDPETAAVSAANLASIDAMEATDPHTLEMTLTQPDAALFSKLSSLGTAIMPSDVDVADVENNPVGTGGFTLQDRSPNQSVTLAANPDYWYGAPALETIEFRVIPDQSAVVSALQAGNVQMAVFDDATVASTVGGEITVEETARLDMHVLQLNSEREPMNDVNVRLAISCAIDREGVLESAAMGEGEVIGPITSPSFKSDPADRPCPERDVEQAKQYLADAGYEDGLSLKMIAMQDGYSTAIAEAQTIQSQLAEAGIEVELEPLESGTYVDRWIATDFDMAVALNGASADPDATYGRYFTSAGNLNDVAAFSTDELDALFLEGRSESDPEARKEIYAEISGYLEDQAPWIWLFTGYNYTAMAPQVQGFEPLVSGSLLGLRDASIG